MYTHGQAVIGLMEQLAPKRYAVEGDKIGLQLGTLQKDITKVLIALDVNDEVVEEAITVGANLIIAHHAIIFRPLAKLDFTTPAGRLYEKLIKHDIAVYISHTNLDVAAPGINEWMAELLALEGRDSLEAVYTEDLYKLVVFVPEDSQEQVREAIWRAGGGALGEYSCCSFNSEGTGTFLPGAGTQPHIGQQGKLERVREVKIETVVTAQQKRRVVQAMIKSHPYEEVAYDLYLLDQKGPSLGLGRVGRLPASLTLAELAEQVKQAFEVPAVRVVGDLSADVSKVAVLGGSGGRYVRHALFKGADVLVTGDIDYHTAQDALAEGLFIIDPGHNIEKLMKPRVAEWLAARLRDQKSQTEVVASAVDTEIFRFV
ncbi:Nif3-like dinuclear metal center hexameric protein [Paenibacillus daejeonensis]|uniref:Nif3-like dinuclear metal center hexameric protein n=1 Tax=Paenibacillus daejeonensis TaxID=135193 RepID=UPI00035D618E|nr:Nif3-like dinuclear metal center hexameric protein [Paenibacillus daejeonensis]